MDVRAVLVPLDGGKLFEIDKDMVLVGRKDTCELHLDQKSVSKLHCVLVKTDGLVVLRDLGSTNGTRVNGTRVRRAALLPNDKVSFANHHFRVHLGPKDAPVSASEHTQHLENHKVGEDQDPPSELLPVEQKIQIHKNELPDVYPDDPKKS